MLFPERGVHASWSFFLLVLLAAVISPVEIVVSVLLAAVLHECGHLLALRAFHVPIEGLRLSALGAVLYARGAWRLSYGRELIVTLAGCGMNLVCGFVTAAFALRISWVEGFVFAGAHILLAVFNLLPIPPLDGSSVLALFIPRKHMHTYYRVQQYAMPVFMIVLIILPYVLHVNPVGVYLDVTAGNVANLLFPFRVS